mmetsp:Transcript_8692/g.14085  ORF Transcript_8692/g.14085 Transcript_8692/m.14085 type:complete len:97 (-) Transcript_8692:3-293(-)
MISVRNASSRETHFPKKPELSVLSLVNGLQCPLKGNLFAKQTVEVDLSVISRVDDFRAQCLFKGNSFPKETRVIRTLSSQWFAMPPQGKFICQTNG